MSYIAVIDIIYNVNPFYTIFWKVNHWPQSDIFRAVGGAVRGLVVCAPQNLAAFSFRATCRQATTNTPRGRRIGYAPYPVVHGRVLWALQKAASCHDKQRAQVYQQKNNRRKKKPVLPAFI